MSTQGALITTSAEHQRQLNIVAKADAEIKEIKQELQLLVQRERRAFHNQNDRECDYCAEEINKLQERLQRLNSRDGEAL